MPGGKEASILIADDDRDVCSVLAMLLMRKGYRVFDAFNGLDAWNRIKELKPTLCLLDIMMPGLSGIEVCRRIRAHPELHRTPIVMLSALTEQEEILEGFRAGATDYITKPFVNAEVLARVNAALREWHLLQVTANHGHLEKFGEHLNHIVSDLERPYRRLLRSTRDIRELAMADETKSEIGQRLYQNAMRSYLVLKELQQRKSRTRTRTDLPKTPPK